MKYSRFEDLTVWQAAITLAAHVFRLTADKRFQAPGDLRSQLQRATLSISNNIVEGFERGTT
jgi:four helix bundle protein